MALTTANRVKEVSTTTGTGTYSLGGTSSGFQSFVTGIGTANSCYYCATDNTSWEIGLGTVTSGAPDTLTRDAIIESSNSGAAVDWPAGDKSIFCVHPGDASAMRSVLQLGSMSTQNSDNVSITGGSVTGLTTLEVGVDRVLTVADEGTGNGLDADTVDGIQGADIALNGSTVSQNLSWENAYVLESGVQVMLIGGTTGNRFIMTPYDDGAWQWGREFGYDPAVNKWYCETDLTVAGASVLTTADEGAGNGIDADLLDGLQASQFLRSDAADTTTSNLTVQGDLYVGKDTGGTTDVFFYDDGSNTWRGIRWNDANNQFELEADSGTYYKIWHDGNDAINTGTTGYMKLPSGWTIQWGATSVAANTTVNVTLPYTYPTAHLQTVAGMDIGGGTDNTQYECGSSPNTTSTISLQNLENVTETIRWFSIGY